MDSSTGRNPVESVSTDEVSAPDRIDGRKPSIDFFPADVVRHRTARWRGVHAKTMQIINHGSFEYRFKQQYHLLVAVEQGVCHDAETFIEGLRRYPTRGVAAIPEAMTWTDSSQTAGTP